MGPSGWALVYVKRTLSRLPKSPVLFFYFRRETQSKKGSSCHWEWYTL